MVNLTFIEIEKTKRSRVFFWWGVGIEKRKNVFGFEYRECEGLQEHLGGRAE